MANIAIEIMFRKKSKSRIVSFARCAEMLVLFVALVTPPISAWCDDLEDAPDTIYLNGRIYTVDDDRRWAEAIAVAGANIVAVGTNAAIRDLADTSTQVVDLGQRMVMPGIHDAHTHLLFAGLKWTHECRLPANAGPDTIIAALQL